MEWICSESNHHISQKIIAGMKPSLKIPLYHHRISTTKHTDRTDKTSQGSQKSIVNNAPACGVENSIEIQVNHKRVGLFVISFLLGSWLPMVFILFLVYNTASVEMASQKAEVSLLKRELESLNQELHLLRSQIVPILASRKDSSFQSTLNNEIAEASANVLSDRESSLSFEDFAIAYRQKRSVVEDTSNNFKEPSSRRRKVSVTNSQRRGKQSRKKFKHVQTQRRRQCYRCLSYNHTQCSVLQAVHFKGAHPEAVVETGRVGPWFLDSKAVKDKQFSSSFQLREDGNSVEIEEPGIYFIYAQVYYLTTHALNSFSIVLVPKDSESELTLAFCSSNAASGSSTSELSCYTAILHTLQAGDRIYIEQREKHRHLIMRTGHSFLGFVKLGGT